MSYHGDWWDDATLTLIGTGDLRLAEEFAAWCAQVDQQMRKVCGLDEETP